MQVRNMVEVDGEYTMRFFEDFKEDEPSHKQYMLNLNKWKKQFHEISRTEDSKSITDCVIKFIEYVINYTSGISCRNQILICNHSFALLQELVDEKFLNKFVKQATQRIFDIVIEEGKNTWCIKKAILKTFNNCLRNVRKDIRYQTASELSDIYLFKIIDSISSYGDYDLQVVIIETIFRMYGKATINARLKDLIPESQELSQSFAEINPEHFDEDVRLFLNNLNKISGKIFSIECVKVKIGDVICVPPIESIEGMWVDFNTWDSAITWYCNESSFREDLSEDQDIWNLITLFVSDVKTVSVHSAAGNPNVIIHCSLQSSCLSKFEPDQPILDQAKDLSLLLSKSEETDKLVDKILPELFGNKLQNRPEARINCNKKISVPTTLEYKPLNIIVRRRSGSVGVTGNVSMTTSYLDPFNTKSDDTAPSSRSSRAITIASSISSSSSENKEFEEISPIKILSGRCSASSMDRGINTQGKKVSISIREVEQSRKKKSKAAELNVSPCENATISPEIFETAHYSAKSSESFQTAELDSQKTYLLNATKNEQSRNYGQNKELPELTEDFSSMEVNIFQNNFVSKKVSCKTYVSTTIDNAETPRMELNDIEETNEFGIGVDNIVPGNTCEAIKSLGFEDRIILTREILSDEHTKLTSELLETKPQFRDQNDSLHSSNSNGDSMKVNIFKDVRNIGKTEYTNAGVILKENQISQDVKNLPLHIILDNDSAAKENIPSKIRSYLDVNKETEESSKALLKEKTVSSKEKYITRERNVAKKSTTPKQIAETEKYISSVSEKRQSMKAIIKENSTLSNDNNMNRVEITNQLSVANTLKRNLRDRYPRNIPEENKEADEDRKLEGRPKKNILMRIEKDNANIKLRGRPKKIISTEKKDDTNKRCRGRPKKIIRKGTGYDENRKRGGRPKKNISGEKKEAVINRIEENIHTNDSGIFNENQISGDPKNLPLHTLDNDSSKKENIPSKIRSFINVIHDSIIEKRKKMHSSSLQENTELGKEKFPKGTGDNENRKRRGRPKKNISGEKENTEISEGYKFNIGDEDSEHVDVYNNIVQENITGSEKLDNAISETVKQKEIWSRHSKSSEFVHLEVTKRRDNSDENIKVVTKDNIKAIKSQTGSAFVKDDMILSENIVNTAPLTEEMKLENNSKLCIDDCAKNLKRREKSTNTFDDETNEESEIIEFSADNKKSRNEDYQHSTVDGELESMSVINTNLALSNEIAKTKPKELIQGKTAHEEFVKKQITKTPDLSEKIETYENEKVIEHKVEATKANNLLVIELQKMVPENEIETISERLVDLAGKINNEETEQEIFNHPEDAICKNIRNNVNEAIEEIQSLHQDEVSDDDNEGDYSGRIHTETDPLPKVLIDPELAFETLIDKQNNEIVSDIISSCDDVQVVKGIGSNLAPNHENELDQIIPYDVRIVTVLSSKEVKDDLNSIQNEKIVESEHANDSYSTSEKLADSEKIEQTVIDRKDVQNVHQEDDHSHLSNNIDTSHVVVESVENVRSLMKNDEIHDNLKTSRNNRVKFEGTPHDVNARTLVKMRKIDLDASLAEKSTNLNNSMDVNQTVSITQSLKRMRKLYNPDDLTDLENMSLIQDESLQQKGNKEISNSVTNKSGLKEIFKKPDRTITQSLDHPIISEIEWNTISSAQKNEKKTKRKLSKGEISYKDVKREQEQLQESIRKRKSSNTNHQDKPARKSNLHSFFADMVGGLREELGIEPLTKKLKKVVPDKRRRSSSSKKNIIVVREKDVKMNKHRKSNELKIPKNKKRVVKPKTLPLPDSSSSSEKSGGFNLPQNNEPIKTSEELPLADSSSFPTFNTRKEKQYSKNILPEFNFDIQRSPMQIEEKSDMRQANKNTRDKINILSDITIHPRLSEDEVQPSKRSRLSHQSYIPNIVYNENHVTRKDLGTKVLKPAPLWESIAVFNGKFVHLKSTDYLGKYLVLLFYPQDFNSAFSMEIQTYSKNIEEFQRFDTEVVGCSVDSQFVHSAWINTQIKDGGLGKINFPLLSDSKHSISRDFGVYLDDLGHTLRGLIIIDAKGIIRHITMSDLSVGSSVIVTLWLIREFQKADKPISEPN